MASVRSSRVVYVNNATTANVTLPVGAAARDMVYLIPSHGFAVSPVNKLSVWTLVDNLAGANYNGAVYKRALTADDITAGSVTVDFTGQYYGTIFAVCMVGNADIRYFSDFRNGAGSLTRSITTDASPQSGDVVLWCASGRANNAVTCNRGASLQTTSNVEASGALYSETLGAAGAITGTFTFGSVPTGDYGAALVLMTPPAAAQVSAVAAHAWLTPPDDKAALSYVAAHAWLTPPDDKVAFGSLSAHAWLTPPDNKVALGSVGAHVWMLPTGTLPPLPAPARRRRMNVT